MTGIIDDKTSSGGEPGLYFCWVEKSVILFSLLAGFPLFYLDTEILGLRRFAWVAASAIGIYHLLLVDDGTETELAGMLDRLVLGFVSVAVVPHVVKLVRDHSWMGLGIVPPFLMVTVQSMHTPVDTSRENYWALRSFLHLFVFLLPYLNHLPSGPQPPAPSEETNVNVGDDQGGKESLQRPGEPEGKPTTATLKKKTTKERTNKKKR